MFRGRCAKGRPSGYWLLAIGYWLLDMGYWIWGMGYGVWDMGYGIDSLLIFFGG